MLDRLRSWLQDKHTNLRARRGDREAANELALALVNENHEGRRARRKQAVEAVLHSVVLRQETLDDLWQLALETRDESLLELLIAQGRPAARRLPEKVASCLHLPAGDGFLEPEEDVAAICLLLALSLDRPPPEGARARALVAAPLWGRRVAQVCLRDDFPEAALELLRQGGHYPDDPEARAAFFFLTGQIERWNELDPDARLLALAYARASSGLAGRIRSQVRRQGSAELARTVLQPLTLPGEGGWEVMLELLKDRPDELWQLVLEAPLVWSTRALRRLDELSYQPADSELYRRLRLQCPDPLLAQEALQAEQVLLSLDSDRMVVHPGSALVAYRGPGCALTVTDCSGQPRGKLFGHLAGEVGYPGRTGDFDVVAVERLDALAFHPGGRLLASGGADGVAIVWDLERMELLQRFECQERWTYLESPRKFRKLVFGPDCLVIQLPDNVVWLLNLINGESNQLYQRVEGRLGISPGRIALARGDQVEIVSLPTLERTNLSLKSPLVEPFVEALALSPVNGQLALSLANRAGDRSLLAWSEVGWQTLSEKGREVTSMSFSPDGANLLCRGEDGLRMFQLSTGRLLLDCKASVHCYSEDGSLLALMGEETLQLRNARTLELIGVSIPSLPERQVLSCCFLADGRLLMVGRKREGYVIKLQLCQLNPLLSGALGSMTPAHLELAMRILPGGGPSGRVREYLRLVLQHRFRAEVQLGERGSSAHDIEL